METITMELIDKFDIADTRICEEISCDECSFKGKDNTCVLRNRVFEMIPTIQAISLDKVKQAREEIDNCLAEYTFKGWNGNNPLISKQGVLEILDKLISESEADNERERL